MSAPAGSVIFVPVGRPIVTALPTWTSGPTSPSAIARTPVPYSSVRSTEPVRERVTTLPSASAARTRASPGPVPVVRSRTGLSSVVRKTRAPASLTNVTVRSIA